MLPRRFERGLLIICSIRIFTHWWLRCNISMLMLVVLLKESLHFFSIFTLIFSTAHKCFYSFRELWKLWGGWLEPYFQVDCILPYTFLALLNENQLICLLSTANPTVKSTLPLIGVLAAVEYAINQNKKDDQVIISCICRYCVILYPRSWIEWKVWLKDKNKSDSKMG